MCAESESSAASFWRRAVSLEEEEEEEDEGVVAFVAVARFLIVLEVRTALELIKVADDNKGDDVIVEVKEKIEKCREKERHRGIGWLEWQEISIFSFVTRNHLQNDFVAINKSCKKNFEEINGSQIIIPQ